MSTQKRIWEAKIIKHHNLNRIAVYFEKRTDLNERIKKIKGARWSQTLKVWHLPDITDLDNKRMQAHIRDAKGKTDMLIYQMLFYLF